MDENGEGHELETRPVPENEGRRQVHQTDLFALLLLPLHACFTIAAHTITNVNLSGTFLSQDYVTNLSLALHGDRGVSVLRLDSCGIEDDGLVEIAGILALNFSSLRYCSLANNFPGDAARAVFKLLLIINSNLLDTWGFPVLMEAEEIEEIEINRGVSGTAALRRKKDAIELVASDQLLRTLPDNPTFICEAAKLVKQMLMPGAMASLQPRIANEPV